MMALAPEKIRDEVRDIAGDIAEKEIRVRIKRNNTSIARDLVADMAIELAFLVYSYERCQR